MPAVLIFLFVLFKSKYLQTLIAKRIQTNLLN